MDPFHSPLSPSVEFFKEKMVLPTANLPHEDDADSDKITPETRLLSEKNESGRNVDVENQEMPAKSRRPSKMAIWIFVNIASTIGIVFVNKRIFDDPTFKTCQLSFAAFHFFITFCTLHAVSTPQIGMFERRQARIMEIMPLAAAMGINVVLVNLSLANSSVPFYQSARVLLTPTVAALNFLCFGTALARKAIYTLIPVCAGVAYMAYFDVKPGQSGSGNTSMLGVIFTIAGVVSSTIYTVMIGLYHKKLQMTSMQLLHQQAIIGAVLLLFGIPFLDTLPRIVDVPASKWVMIMLSGLCACLINLSQFTIISGAGPVFSTVVGHIKTICIVAIGWIMGGKAVNQNSVLGVVVAITGVIAYSAVTMDWRKR